MLQLNTNIKLIRELSGKKQLDFARLIKTNLSNLKTYENTDVRPKANVIAAIADIAGISTIDLENKALTHKDIQFGSIKANNGHEQPPKELPWQIIDRLSKGIENITEANLILAKKISSGGSVLTPLSGQVERTGIGREELPLSGKIKPGKKRRGT